MTYARYRYPSMTRTEGKFKLRVIEGEFTDCEIIVLLGENGTGKTTFMRMLVLFIFLFFFLCLIIFSLASQDVELSYLFTL